MKFKVVNLNDIAENGYSLNPKDYFSQNQEAIHHYMWKSKQNIKDEE